MIITHLLIRKYFAICQPHFYFLLILGWCVESCVSFSTRTAARYVTSASPRSWSPASRDTCPTSPPSPTASGAPPSSPPSRPSTAISTRAPSSWTKFTRAPGWVFTPGASTENPCTWTVNFYLITAWKNDQDKSDSIAWALHKYVFVSIHHVIIYLWYFSIIIYLVKIQAVNLLADV